MDDRTFIEWDKDDIDALNLMKVDILALGMLTCIRKCFDLMSENGMGDPSLNLDMASDDPAVYEMLKAGRSLGVFQVESRAQMSMLPRLKPKSLYDLTVQVAIVRPGPIQGNMVHPYLRRRSTGVAWDYPSPKPPHDPDELKEILGETYGVPLFQEQAMKLAIVAAAFTPSEANQLRRAMATFRNVGTIHEFEAKMVEGMVARGYDRDFAQRCYDQIKGFGSYGFPESHALSFARLVMYRRGSSAITRRCSPADCSIRSRWGFTRQRRSCARRRKMAGSRARRSTSISACGTTAWSRGNAVSRCGSAFGRSTGSRGVGRQAFRRTRGQRSLCLDRGARASCASAVARAQAVGRCRCLGIDRQGATRCLVGGAADAIGRTAAVRRRRRA